MSDQEVEEKTSLIDADALSLDFSDIDEKMGN
jgi:hypothetical protein